eukprot:TRINITY_DN4056_c0_g1_i1.p1 TRINITY_DN4056_c0_g1~~TRINITY_DN4056_c0_g1_i1.p1  ORF type:complete len:250 (+),score=33.14 TRINITY_DN4056_c0_g1_i1:77-826(+)
MEGEAAKKHVRTLLRGKKRLQRKYETQFRGSQYAPLHVDKATKQLVKQPEIFIRPEKLIKKKKIIEEAKRKQRNKIKNLKAKKNHRFAHGSLVFVIRLPPFNPIPPEVLTILASLRLFEPFSGRFFKLNLGLYKKLELISAYITWGHPSLKITRELIQKRAGIIANGKQYSTVGNAEIETHLGKYGIVCHEDIVKEVYEVGKHFTEVNEMLMPFLLSSSGLYKVLSRGAILHLAGERGTEIDGVIQKMN